MMTFMFGRYRTRNSSQYGFDSGPAWRLIFKLTNSDIGSFDNRRRCFSVSIAIHYLAPEKERQRKGSGPIAGRLFDNALVSNIEWLRMMLLRVYT
jgi:hypothetical protein